jgi:protein-tyrosine-phosphatase
MAEALLRHRLPPDAHIEVASAGTVGDGTPPPSDAVEAMAEIGLDIAGRPSRPLTSAEVHKSDLVVGMGRDHLVAAAALCPPALGRSFTLSDLLQRARSAGGRLPSETVADWAGRLGAGRTQQAVLTLPSSGDVADPIGRGYPAFEQLRAQLERMTGELAMYLTGTAPAQEPPPEGSDRRPLFGRRRRG